MSNALHFRYSPLGWAQWLYGPILLMAGLFLVWGWVGEVAHHAQNNDNTDAFVIVGFGAYLLVAVGMAAVGALMVSFDRVSTVAGGRLETRRGRFLPWRRESFAVAELAWSVEEVPVVMVFGSRASTVGSRFRVVATLARSGKPLRRIISLRPTKDAAERDVADIRGTM